MSDLPYSEHVSPDDMAKLTGLVWRVGTLDDALLVFGETLGHSADGRSPIERARDSFRRLMGELRPLLCDDHRIAAFLRDPRADTLVNIATVITGKLADVKFSGVDYVALAVLCAKFGLQQLCSSRQSPP